MRQVHVRLESPVSRSFRCQRAADSLDIDTAAKSVHELSVELDIETPFHVGLIVGASGTAKTTLAHRLFGADCFHAMLDLQASPRSGTATAPSCTRENVTTWTYEYVGPGSVAK